MTDFDNPMAQYGFPKTLRLLKPKEFDQVFRQRCSTADGLIVLHVARNQMDQPRLGTAVSRKHGNAVVRNRWKRSLREAFRLVQHDLPRSLDLVVLPRRNAQPNVARLQNSLMRLASKAASKLPPSQPSKKGSA